MSGAGNWALLSQAGDLARVIDLVVLEDAEFFLLPLVLVLLGGGVLLLLALLSTTTQAEHQVEGRLLLDVVVGQSPPVLQLLPGKDQSRQVNVIIN